ncbi:MAG TPA: mismatch repair protein, partial [Verrucomicrobiae bacterium]|nr:mismatch repair protein [Verrucomicrobiae bacterium]
DNLRVRLNPESLIGWAEAGSVLPRHGLRLVAIALSLCIVGALIYWAGTGDYLPLLIGVIIAAIVNRSFHNRIKEILGEFPANADGVLLFARILERIEAETFTDPRLQKLSAELKRGGTTASSAIRKLARLAFWIDAHHSLIGAILEWLVLYSLQLAAAAEAWRRKYGRRMRACVEITAEMEALLSLAAYSHEHPADPFPEIVETPDRPALFEGKQLGHPLIPVARCIRNSVTLNADTQVLLVSGSNMSGKSTLMRTVGINAVLAFAGAPIRGKALRLTPLSLGTRIRTVDSLQEGLSNFYAEILRIRKVFELLGGERPVLFLFDELLEGTNSHDRRIGAESLVRALIDDGAIGIVTTHDLALTDMAASMRSAVRNAHFEDYIENGEMRFDFKLREGVVTKSNALELMRLVGLKV